MNRPRRALLLAALLAASPFAFVPATSATPQPSPAELSVRDAWARATPPGTGVAAVYLTIEGGARADTLRAASTAIAMMTQIHTVTEADGMARVIDATSPADAATDMATLVAGATISAPSAR